MILLRTVAIRKAFCNTGRNIKLRNITTLLSVGWLGGMNNVKNWGHFVCQHITFLEAAYFVSEFGTGCMYCVTCVPVDTFDFDLFILQCHNLVSGVYKTSCRTGKYDAPHVSFLLHIIHHIISYSNTLQQYLSFIGTGDFHPIPTPIPIIASHVQYYIL